MALNEFVTPERAAELAALLGSAFLKSTLVLFAGFACALAARAASAATRHLIWSLALGGALVVPGLSAVVPKWSVPVLPWSAPDVRSEVETAPIIEVASAVAALPHVAELAAPPVVEPDAPPAPGEPLTTVSAPEVPPPAEAGVLSAPGVAPAIIVADAPAESSVSMPGWLRAIPWIVALWLAGALLAIAPTVLAQVRLMALRRRAHPVRGGRWALLIPSALREIDVRRRVEFLEMEGAAMPMTWGIVNPVVLLPEGDFDSTVAQRLDVLRHELAHVRRHDCLTQLIAQLSCAVLWFNPLAWVAARQLRIERERACDDEVLRAGAKPSDYAGYLLRVARSMHVGGATAYGGLAMARPSQLAGRLLAVLDEDRPRARLSTRTAVRAVSGAAIAAVATASLSPTARAADSATVRDTIEALVAPPATPDAPPAPNAAVPSPDIGAAIDPASPALASPAPDAPALMQIRVPRAIAPLAVPATAARLAPAFIPAVQPTAAPCDGTAPSSKRGSSTNLTSSRDGAKRWQVIWREGNCSYEIDARGEITFNADVTDIQSISRGGSFSIEQDLDGDTRRLVVRPSDGGLDHQYSVNGDRREYDAAARAWLAEALVALDRQTAFAADQRVPAILNRGGVDAVFQEISRLGSDYARRKYYTKLLSMRTLDRAQVRRVVEQAGAEMASDYELAELLISASKLDAFTDDSHSAFVTASKTIGSDYERRRVLNTLLRRDQLAPATVEALLEAASSIGSDYELASLLIDVSKRYAINERTRPVYIKAVGTIESDYEHRRVLSTVVASGGLSAGVTRALLEDARRIGSDYELVEFLVQVAKQGTLDETTRDAYFAAANKIKSDYEHRRALSPLVKRDLLTKELARSVLASAATIDSDYEAATLLVDIARTITIDDDLRPAFERAADTIQGEYEYGRAMAAVRRSRTR